MAQDDRDGSDADGELSPSWLTRRPFLTSVAIGVIAALFVGLMLPADTGAPVPEDVTVRVSVTKETPKVASADTKSGDVKPALGAPPAPSVPIVAEAAIVIADTGLNHKVAEETDKDLPRDTTLAISVYASDPASIASAFKASGRDVWLQAATQSTKGGIDPGPLAVSSSLSTQENSALFARQLDAAGKSISGIYVPDDADITGVDPDMWRDLATDLISRNMMILDGTTAKVATTLYMQKQEAQISAYLKTDVIVSGDLGLSALQKALADAVPIILHEQQAIVVLNHPTVLAVQTLADWVKTLPSKGIRLVPATKFTGLKP